MVKVAAKFVTPGIAVVVVSCDPEFDDVAGHSQLDEISLKLTESEFFGALKTVERDGPLELSGIGADDCEVAVVLNLGTKEVRSFGMGSVTNITINRVWFYQ